MMIQRPRSMNLRPRSLAVNSLHLRCSVMLLLVALFSVLSPAFAHQASDAFVDVAASDSESATRRARVDVALRDLDLALDLDADRDGRLTWGEVKDARVRIDAFLDDGVRFGTATAESASKACENGSRRHEVARHSDGPYLVATYDLRCAAGPLAIDYRLLRDMDTQHRAIIRSGGVAIVVKPGERPVTLAAVSTPADGLTASDASVWDGFASFIASGVHHILVGWDHLAFLVVLLIPSVLVARIGSALRRVFATATAFTVAHSITLSLAALGWVALPAAPIEAAIAASIVVTALFSLRTISRREASKATPFVPMLMIAFGFGLVHGFGFANVLGDAGLAGTSVAASLLGFNLGVEIGQLAFIAVVLPILWIAARSRMAAIRVAVPVLTLMLGAAGIYWFIERAMAAMMA